MKHGTYDDFWKARNLRPHLKNIKPAVMTVGGWFDAENLFGALEVYKNVKKNSPKTEQRAGDGPVGPRRLEPASDGSTSSATCRSTPRRPSSTASRSSCRSSSTTSRARASMNHPEAWVFETGTNVWRKHDAWPPKNAKSRSLYFHAGGKLRDDTPADGEPEIGHDEYVSDPAKPVPYIDKIAIGMSPEYMTADQRFAARRPDVLVYETDVLDEDVTIAGPIEVEPVRLDDRHRRRLGGEGDRRLSRTIIPIRTRTRRACRWAAISSWCAAT